MRRTLIAASLAASAALGAVAATATAATAATKLTATLSGKAEGPGGPRKATGSVAVIVNGGRVCWSFSHLRGVDRPLLAHIHKGTRGETGGIVLALGQTYARRGCTATTAAQARQFVLSPFGFYVNLHTKRYPLGAVRGQLRR